MSERGLIEAGEVGSAGWYVDPSRPAQVRWWDGARWTDAVQAMPTPSGEAHRPGSTPAGCVRCTIRWGAVGMFLLAAGAATTALVRGQEVCEVSASGLRFCDDGGGDTETIDRAQDVLSDRAATNAEQVREGAVVTPKVDAVDLTGVWSASNGFTYAIEQVGDQATITEVAPDGTVTAAGVGLMDGASFDFDYTAADLSTGFGILDLTGSGQLEGSSRTSTRASASTSRSSGSGGIVAGARARAAS